jgi:hypothetical protein
MAEYFSTTALSELLNAALENSTTSIELLRLRHASEGNLPILELGGTFGDEILNHILVDGSRHTTELELPRQPYLQIL